MRALAPDMDPDVVSEIDRRLARVADEHAVSVPWAIESGSRAWGFPSPDSDYDCRFFFVRPLSAYASPWRPRDVIETPLDPVYDVNGWDLLKAVRLATSGNATVGEWLRSPLVYHGDPTFRDELLDLVDRTADRGAVARHYLHVGRQQWNRSGAAGGGDVALKQVFYALRPAATLHWMRRRSGVTPPMDLASLLAEAPPSALVAESVAALVDLKARTRELGRGPVPTPIHDFVMTELGDLQESVDLSDGSAGADGAGRAAVRRADAEATFLRLVETWGQRPPGPTAAT